MFLRKIKTITLIIFLLASACTQYIPKQLLELSESNLEIRSRQTRVFQTNNEAEVLSSGLAVLQDMGFALEESASKLGLLVASKTADAQKTWEIFGSIMIGALASYGNSGYSNEHTYDVEQKIRVAFVSTRSKQRGGYAVRVTFQRIILNNLGQITKSEAIDDPKIYQQFFQQLSSALFLEANQL